MKKYIIIILILVALIAVGGYRIYKIRHTQQAESIDTIQLKTGVPVRVTEVRRMNLQKKVSVSGSIEPFQAVGIAPKLTERIEQIHVTAGQKVKRGDLLVTLETIDSKLRRAQAQAENES